MEVSFLLLLYLQGYVSEFVCLQWLGSQHRVSYKRAAYFCEGRPGVSPGWRANYAFRVGTTLREVDFCRYLQGYVSERVCLTCTMV